ncbi:hypothetical protein AURDEDRAFT_116565 [Auricularia subglabra TFB-10046 SS5]|nr:hypothetical protein AURDEDRAFT_116565 [Auricularia subglabra TFB-10046 SS5]
MLRRSWPRIRSSLRFAAGAEAETGRAFSLSDGTVCRDPRILRKTAVFLCTSASIFASAAWVTNHYEAYWWAKAMPVSPEQPGSYCAPVTGKAAEDGPCLLRVQAAIAGVRNWRDVVLSPLPERLQGLFALRWPFDKAESFIYQRDSFRVATAITAANVAVFLAWRCPRLWRSLGRHGIHHGLSGRSYTLFTAGFCHTDVFHIACNTACIYFFAGGLEYIAARDGAHSQWTYSVPHLTAFWIVACAFGLYFPNTISLVAFRNRIRALPPATTLMSTSLEPWHPVPLLMHFGASAGMYSIATLNALSPAGDKVVPVDILGYSITSRQGWLAFISAEAAIHLVAFTSAPAHLSGALFGAIYYHYGAAFWDRIRTAVGNRKTWYGVESRRYVKACVRV